MLLPLAPVLLGPTSRVRVASTVRPSFFLSAPEMAPRMCWCCHPVADAVRYVAIMLFMLLLLRQLAKIAL